MDWKNTISKDSRIRDSLVALSSRVRFVKQNLVSSESLLRIVVNKSHLARRASHYVLYPKFLVNYPFVSLTANLDIRITTRIGIYTKYPVNLYFRTIDLSFGIANLPFCIDSGKFGYTTGILGSTPSSGNKEYPLQWKLRVDPRSGNMVMIRQTPTVEIMKGKPND